MSPDEHSLSGSGGGCTGGISSSTITNSKSKKGKQKKVPQRGLGVAQLERIREETEAQKRDAANRLPNNEVSSSSNNEINPSLVAIQIPNSRPTSSLDHGNWSRLWSGGYNSLEGEEKQREFAFHKGNNSVFNFPSLPHNRSYGQLQHSPTMVNAIATSGISASSLLLCSQMEPPSNQNFRDDYKYAPSFPEVDDKMTVGKKRSYPFLLGSSASPPPPPLSFHSSFSTYGDDDSRPRLDDLSYTAAHMEPRKKIIREIPSNSSSLPEVIRYDDEGLNGHLLTLATPAAASPTLNAMHEHPLNNYLSHQGRQLSDSNHLPTQGNPRSRNNGLVPSSGSREEPFSFFPDKLKNDQTTTSAEKSPAAIDLNLKL